MRIRENIKDLSVGTSVLAAETEDEEIVQYFNRNEDHGLLKAALAAAYDEGVRPMVADVDNSVSTFETYADAGSMVEKLETGEIDALNVGWGHKIANAKATLFTEPGLRFSLEGETEDKDMSDVMEFLEGQREKGGFIAQNVAANRLAVFRGSCLMLVSYLRKNLRYKLIYPGQIRVKWGDVVEEDGRKRPVDRLDLEDASVVLIRLGQVGMDKHAYLGIIPSNPEVPYGRYVTFIDSLMCTEIPEVGKEGVIDYTIDDGSDSGLVCNPLTYFALQNPDLDVPEIPLAVMYGGTTRDEVLCPVFRTLYEQSMIFDKKGSHIFETVEEKAVGTLAIERDPTANGMPLPRKLSGKVALQPGQTIRDIAHDATAADIAHNISRMNMVDVAASYSVPDFMVVSEDHTVDASSGRALDIKARPLKKDRKNMVDLNGPYVDRLFQIERSLLGFVDSEEDPDPMIAELLAATQNWEAGSLHLPEDKKEVAERIIALTQGGFMDTIAGIREYYQLPSDEDAKAKYKEMADRMEEFPPLNQAEKDREREMEFELKQAAVAAKPPAPPEKTK